jgi:signal transduction histidine kinase
MRRVLWGCWITLLLLLGAFLLRVDPIPPSAAQLTHAMLLAPDGSAVERVNLRYVREAAPGEILRIRLRLDMPHTISQNQPLALYVPGNLPFASVQINGVQIFSAHPSDNPRESFNRPLLVQLPFDATRPIESIELTAVQPPGNAFILVRPVIGPIADLQQNHFKRYSVRVVGSQIMGVVLILAAIGSLVFWTFDPAFKTSLWFGLFCSAAALAALTGINTITPPVPWSIYHHFTMFFATCSSAALAQFMFEQTNVRSKTTDRLLIAQLVLGAVLGVTLFEDKIPFFRYALVMDLIILLMGCYVLWVLVRAWLQRRDSFTTILVTGAALTFLLALHTIVTSWHPEVNEDSLSVVFAPLPLMFAMGWVMLRRYARTRLRTDALNRRLAKRVAQREREIKLAYQKLMRLERTEAIQLERDRMMRDMHDGLGSQLIVSMRMAERGVLTSEAMQKVLSDCVDEMHLAVESLKPTGDDLFIVLADYRYRLEPRLEAAHIKLSWHIEASDAVKLTAQKVLVVMRIMNEAIGNALKHASAPELKIYGRFAGNRYDLTISNPVSETAIAPSNGNGLTNMRRRTSDVNARLSAQIENGWYTMRLSLAANT